MLLRRLPFQPLRLARSGGKGGVVTMSFSLVLPLRVGVGTAELQLSSPFCGVERTYCSNCTETGGIGTSFPLV